MTGTRRIRLAMAVIILAVAAAAGVLGSAIGRRFEFNRLCCEMPAGRNLSLSIRETLGLAWYPSQIGQDKWLAETVFPGETDGFFVDVGSGDGIDGSNTAAVERKGWKGICIDPFPTNMETRTCQLFKEVVHREAGLSVKFHPAGGLGGIADTLGAWRTEAEKAPPVEFTTVTLGELLDRANAPRYIHFMSLDIEGAELEALRGVPLDKYRFGAFAIEHNYEGTKRMDIQRLLEGHGYRLAHTWQQDDLYVEMSHP